MALAIRFRSPLHACLFAACAQDAVQSAGGTIAAASGTVSASPVVSGATTLSSGVGISVLGYVFTVLILAVAAVAVLFRGGFLGVFSGGSKAERKLHIEETRSLGHRQHLVVASYEGRRFLLGVCPGSIEYLSGLDAEGSAPAGSFQELLASAPKASGEKSPAQKDAP
jgi:flagellar biogenesis protein FliO